MKKQFRSSSPLMLAIIFFLVPAIVFSQLQKAVPTTKLDPRLQQIVDNARMKSPAQRFDAQLLHSETSADGKERFPCFVHSSTMQRLRSDGIPLQTIIGTFATARLTVEELELLENHTAVQFVQPTTVEYPHNDVAAAFSGADVLHSGNVNSTEYTGSGVIVGIIDTGIDWDHLDFCDPADPTLSRILYIWDQTITATGAESTPASFAYGVEYTKAHIDAELDGTPIIDVRETDVNGHGTHVAGTAAGNGSSLSTKKYKGIAPDADIIVVKAGDGSFSTTNIVDAISYLDEKATAAGKPLVINMSLGSDAGPHDGKDAKGLAVESFSGAGRIAVMSAGNSGSLPIHFTGSVGANDSAAVTFTIPSYTAAGGASNDVFQFDVWLDNSTAVTAKVVSPGGHTATQVPTSAAVTQTDEGTIYLYNDINGNNGDRNIFSQVYDDNASVTPAQGTWTLRLINTSGSAVAYHGWLFDYTIGIDDPVSVVTVAGGDTNYTIDNCSDSAITVGSYASRWKWKSTDGFFYSGGAPDYSDDISDFSSIGPSRTGAQKPDIAAPGQHIVSALSSNASYAASGVVVNNLYVKNQGTSMSAPVVAGAVALLLQNNPDYSTQHVKSLLTSTALTDGYTGGSLPDAYWGYGKLDILHAMVKAVDGGFSFSHAIPASDGWGSDLGTLINSGEKIATRFTAPINGVITGALFHPSQTQSLSGPLNAEVWSDNGAGLPNVKLGSTVSADQNAIAVYSWNAVDMTGSGVSVSASTDYHLVLYYNTSGTEFSIRHDNSPVDVHSSINSGSGWSASSSDYRIRPVIMTDLSALPVELIAFSGTETEHGVRLDWSTATEVNNYGFEIQRSDTPTPPSPLQGEGKGRGPWTKAGFVNGSGTSNAPNSYSFIDKNLRPGRFSYRLKQIDLDGKFSYSNQIEVSFGQLPVKFSLEQNYPNPFNPATEIRYTIPTLTPFSPLPKGEGTGVRVTLKVYDAIGREVATLANEVKEPGSYSVTFNASHLASGIYFARLQSNGKQSLRKMLLLR